MPCSGWCEVFTSSGFAEVVCATPELIRKSVNSIFMRRSSKKPSISTGFLRSTDPTWDWRTDVRHEASSKTLLVPQPISRNFMFNFLPTPDKPLLCLLYFPPNQINGLRSSRWEMRGTRQKLQVVAKGPTPRGAEPKIISIATRTSNPHPPDSPKESRTRC